MIKIAFLDAKTVGEVANFRVLEKQGDLKIYETTRPEDVVERSQDKDIIITNKVVLDKPVMEKLPNLKMICVSATGTNNIDLVFATEKGITVTNVAGYSTESVAQLTFSMLLYLINRPYYFDAYVKSGAYSKSELFTHLGHPFWELSGKRMGIIGLGTIGRRVAQISQAFGMEVVFYSTTGRNNNINYKRFDLDTLLSTSDVVSIHAPLTEQTRGLINYEKMKQMRPCCHPFEYGPRRHYRRAGSRPCPRQPHHRRSRNRCHGERTDSGQPSPFENCRKRETDHYTPYRVDQYRSQTETDRQAGQKYR